MSPACFDNECYGAIEKNHIDTKCNVRHLTLRCSSGQISYIAKQTKETKVIIGMLELRRAIDRLESVMITDAESLTFEYPPMLTQLA